MDEVQLAERLIAYDTSRRTGIGLATDFVAGWLEARGAAVEQIETGGRRCLVAGVGSGPVRLVYHGHLDVVPGHPQQFTPRLAGGRLIGRGAYDMKAALAAMMLAVADLAPALRGARLDLVVVPDEERAEPGANCTEMLVRDGFRADFVVCGEPTDLQVGVQAKGVLMLRADVPGTSAHGSTPWLGENAVLRAVDLYRRIERLPFASESAPSVGRDGASDAVAFLEVGVPAVEYGPRGGGHHGPEEYVEVESLPRYRRALTEFARSVARAGAGAALPEVAP